MRKFVANLNCDVKRSTSLCMIKYRRPLHKIRHLSQFLDGWNKFQWLKVRFAQLALALILRAPLTWDRFDFAAVGPFAVAFAAVASSCLAVAAVAKSEMFNIVDFTYTVRAPTSILIHLFIADWITWRSPAPWGCMTPLGPICMGPGWPCPCCCPAMWMGTPEGAMPELSGCCWWSPPPICCHCCCWGCDPAPPAIVTVPPVIPAIPIVIVIPPGGPPTEEVGICWPGMVTYVTQAFYNQRNGNKETHT